MLNRFFPAQASILVLFFLWSGDVHGEIPVTNPSFEQGAERPLGWTLTGGSGGLLRPGAAGRQAVQVAGDGQSSSSWLSEPLPLEPSTTYRLRFQARRVQGTGGLPTSGFVFCNRDLSGLGQRWQSIESYARTPRQLTPDNRRLRFGQWQVDGQVAYDAIRLDRVIPVYRAGDGGIRLGDGEVIRGQRYTFQAPLGGRSANCARPLAWHQCDFNSNRWRFGSRHDEVVYRHHVGPAQQAASVQVQISWYARGRLVVSGSVDGQTWQALETLDKSGALTAEVPASWLPADTVWIRLSAEPLPGETGNPSLQVDTYRYESTLAGQAPDLNGLTHFLAVTHEVPGLAVTVRELGEALPGGDNYLSLEIANEAERPARLAIAARTEHQADGGAAAQEEVVRAELRPGAATRLRVPYRLRDAGTHRLTLRVSRLPAGAQQEAAGGRSPAFAAEARLRVPALHATGYGFALPGSTPEVALWWCSSGWKVSRRRPAPAQQAAALRIRAAANEAEAAQLVLRPARPLPALTVTPGALQGPGAAIIPADRVQVLRVGYVHVTRPTDATGTVGHWPDPLPPLTGPLNLQAGRNQPLWILVRVPPAAPTGTYRGQIELTAPDYRAEVPLEVEVYGFPLPERMTCETAFGLSTGTIWKYHGLQDESQRRQVLEQYLSMMASHHLSPYDPAPLDPIAVRWEDQQETPRAVLDFTAWDRAMSRAVDVHHFNTFRLRVLGLGGGTFHNRYEPELLGFAEDTPQYRAAMASYLGQLQSHLQQRGWLDEAFVYWFDEPDPKDYDFVMNGFAKLKRWAPGLRRMLTEQVEPALVGGPNLWCPVTPNYDHEQAEARRAAGEEFWWYVCTGPKAPYCTLFIDHPATELRVWLWQTWKRDIRGILVWSSNYWTSSAAYPDPAHPQNPYEDPMGWVSGYSTPSGTRRAWGNGDGRFLYPPLAAADGRPSQPVLDGPVSSIRLEMLRDGIEDYEYCVLLRELLDQHRDKLSPADRARYEKLLEVPETISRDMTHFTKDPRPIEQHRDRVARAIEALRQP